MEVVLDIVLWGFGLRAVGNVCVGNNKFTYRCGSRMLPRAGKGKNGDWSPLCSSKASAVPECGILGVQYSMTLNPT